MLQLIIDSYSGEQSSKSFTVVRVPGGWIYRTERIEGSKEILSSSVFVPLDYEFQKRENDY